MRLPGRIGSASNSSRHSLVRVLVIIGVTCGVGMLHHLIPNELTLIDLYYLTQRLYYLPVVYAGLYFGWRGGLATALFAAFVYLPQIVEIWKIHPRYTINQYTEIMLFCIVGVLTGVLADRERMRKRVLQETAEQMARLYAELQDNFERMKRVERLYALGQLSAGLAHEIRNPLASIEGAATVLQRQPASEERRAEFLQIIQKECRRLNLLLTNFLNFAKPPAPEYKTIVVEQMFDAVIMLAEHAIPGNSIVLRKQFAANLPPVECDPEQITQVLVNLTINAIQAMPKGGEILLSTQPGDRYVAIQVRDEGSGVSEQDRERIFDPFYTTKEFGTGLGLAISHQIVQQHGGNLTARRNSGRGMTFTVQLPWDHRRTR
jgi:two-component system, NtrC family, sensor histidine kinase HydH